MQEEEERIKAEEQETKRKAADAEERRPLLQKLETAANIAGKDSFYMDSLKKEDGDDGYIPTAHLASITDNIRKNPMLKHSMELHDRLQKRRQHHKLPTP